MSFYRISGVLYAGREEDILAMQRFIYFWCLTYVSLKFMFTKRKIVVIIGIIVAILITFYTGVFGITGIA
jgi:hypothetical protein